MSKISIIIPVFNGQNYIVRCVNSVLANTFTDFELLLINDGSTDNSLSIIKNLALNDKRIKVIDKSNEGVAKTRNMGIKIAKSPYVMFIDNDDMVENDYLQVHYDLISETKCKVAMSGFKRTNSNGKLIRKEVIKDYYWSRYMYVSPWAKIFDRQFLIENNIEFFNYGIGEDVVFNLKLQNLRPSCVISSYIGYDWYYNDNSVSNTKQIGFSDDVDILVLLDTIIEQCKVTPYLKFYFIKYYVWYMLYCGKSSNNQDFIKQNERIKNWLFAHKINIPFSIFSKKIKGEKLSNRFIVGIFLLLNKTHIIKLFAKIYCN